MSEQRLARLTGPALGRAHVFGRREVGFGAVWIIGITGGTRRSICAGALRVDRPYTAWRVNAGGLEIDGRALIEGLANRFIDARTVIGLFLGWWRRGRASKGAVSFRFAIARPRFFRLSTGSARLTRVSTLSATAADGLALASLLDA